jgi:2-polyprenyl-6-hydroxyphenyl methylase/3-demethylubiquinone-9 3-methyltransferase
MLALMHSLKPTLSEFCACKICGGNAPLYGVVDFHRACDIAKGAQLSLSGVPIYYRRCEHCGFLFTDAFDNWDMQQFKTHIYNSEYELVDPDYETKRPRDNADFIARYWGAMKEQARILDYGGGNGTLSAALREYGFQTALTYDPMVPGFSSRPEGKYDLVTSFETLEHVPDPVGSVADILEYSAEPGLIFFSTLVQPADFDRQRLNWWYVGPRNGHISLFSKRALAMVWNRFGYKVASLTDDIHFAFRTLPSFLPVK